MKRYVVEIKAFGHVRRWTYEARDRHEAIEKAKQDVGYSLTCEPAVDIAEQIAKARAEQ